MKAVKTILIIFSMAAAVFAQNSKVVPIVELSVKGITGGVKNGKWISPKEVAPTLGGRENYSLIGNNKIAGKAIGSKPRTEEVCPDYFGVRFDSKMMSGIALGANANWNPQPRVPNDFSTSSETYKEIVADVLRSKGIAAPKVSIRQAYRIDLDGDGTDEVVLSATSYKPDETLPGVDPGDYSFILLRKIVFSEVKNLVLAGEFYNKKIESAAPNEFQISAIADLNGDNNMEIVTRSQYYEGRAASVFEIKCTKIVEVLSTGCGV